MLKPIKLYGNLFNRSIEAIINLPVIGVPPIDHLVLNTRGWGNCFPCKCRADFVLQVNTRSCSVVFNDGAQLSFIPFSVSISVGAGE